MTTIGIDPSIAHPAIATYPDGNTWLLPTKGEGAERLAYLATMFRDFLLQNTPPDLTAAFIERVTGRFPNHALAQASGVLQATVINTFRQSFPHPVSVFALSPGEWKRLSVGHGNATKDQVQEWCRAQGFTPDNEHTADALAIAHAGYQLLEAKNKEAA